MGEFTNQSPGALEHAARLTSMEEYSSRLKLTGAHKAGVLCCTFSPTGSYILSGSQDRTIQLWNADNGKPIAKFDGHGQAVRGVECFNDSSSLVSVGQDKQFLVWDVGRVTVSRKIRAHDGEINCVRLNADNSVAITGGADRKVHVWDLRSRNYSPVQTLQHAKDGISSLCVSKYEICAGSLDGEVRQYDLRAGKLRTDRMGGPAVMGVQYSNDGNCLLVTTLDSRLRLLDKSSGDLLNDYRGHKNETYKTDATLSRDDALVLAGSEDGLIHVWDLVEAKSRAVLRGHAHVVTSLAYSPIGDAFVSGSIDRSLIVWK